MNDLKIRWIGQGGYLLTDGENSICIDPYLSNAVDRVAKRGRMVEAPFAPDALVCDAVICTHNHLDHLDIDAIPEMKKDNMLFLAPTDAKETLLSCGVTLYHPFDESATYKIGNFRLRAVYAVHSVPAIGVIVIHDGVTLYFSGDTEYSDKLAFMADYDVDMMFVCINGRLGNMNVDEAVHLTRIIMPKVAIPTHYGMFESNTEDPKKFVSQLCNGFEMEYNKEYSVKEVIRSV